MTRRITAAQARAFAKRSLKSRHPDADLTVEFKWLGQWTSPRFDGAPGELVRIGRVTARAPGFKTADLRLHASTISGLSIF